MNRIQLNLYRLTKRHVLFGLIVFFSVSSWSQEPNQEQDSIQTGYEMGELKKPMPNSVESKYTYDPISDRYIYSQKVGNYDINYPIILTPEEYYKLVAKENLKSYYKEKIDAFDGQKEGSEEAQKNLLPEFYVNSGFFESIFGSNTIEVVPQGSVEMDLGVLYSKQDNPAFSPRNRSNFTFDFDQRISLSLMAKVGTRLQINANYDTQSTFDFQNLIKLEFTPTEDDIIRKIEVGNVNMPLNSSLISGAQSLFGVKTQLQFGKTTVTAVFSEQKSQANRVVSQGGGTLEEFDFFVRDYDENRHFFLAQYFRDNYDKALSKFPFIDNKGLQITRVEVWVTNRSNRTENVRNVVALQDLGESDKIGSAVNVFGAPGAFPSNENNAFNPSIISESAPNSQLNERIREIASVNAGIEVSNFNEGFDYAVLENARKLIQGREFTINSQLGYISLNQRLNNDEVLAVAFQFTVGGQVYQVGEFANDGVDATNVSTGIVNNPSTGLDETVTTVVSSNLILKLLKSSITNVNLPIWDLMMKNIYDTGAYNLSQDDFRLNIFYNEASPLNYITPVPSTPFPAPGPGEDPLQESPLLRVFSLDRLNFNNDPQSGGDGFFDFVSGITVIPEGGKIIFPSVEPFGEFLFKKLESTPGENYSDPTTYNDNQNKYVYNLLYSSTKTAALEQAEKNKFRIKGRYKSSGGNNGIPIGGFNVPRGSVRVTAGGRLLVEGIDYTVNYTAGTVQILDEALKASNTPIEVSTENNAMFAQQTRRFSGINIEHKFNDNFILGGTLLNLNERPITQKANFGTEPINNTIFGFNTNYSTKVPLFTRLVNKLPNTDTDVESNLSVRGEFAYLLPGSPKGTDFNGEATSYIDDFEGSQNGIDLTSPQSWFLSSRPKELNKVYSIGSEDASGIQNGFDRALLNWYSIDPIFYSNRRPTGITDEDVSSLYTSRVFINELFPERDVVQGQNTVLFTLDLAYYPQERGPYNFQLGTEDGIIENPFESWAGITRQITSTDFEQQNVEYIDFWLQDPFQDNPLNPGGSLVFNLGNISEDIIKDGSKLYENGLPKNGEGLLKTTTWGTVVPQNQSLVYAFDSTGQERANQDLGYDGLADADEQPINIATGLPYPELDVFSNLADPSNDNYEYFLQAEGNIFDRYKKYNGVEGNSPDTFSDTQRGATTQPDVEDINRDNTMNTIDSYFEYELELKPEHLPSSIDEISSLPSNNPIKEYIRDVKIRPRNLPNGDVVNVRWYQFRVPVNKPTDSIGGISDFRSIRFARMYLKEFSQPVVFRFGTLDLVRSDWRRYSQTLDGNPLNANDENTDFSLGIVGTIENEGSYLSPPSVVPEQLFNNNTVVRQNEQSLVTTICDLESEDSRAAFKNISVDMRQYKRLRMFMHAEEEGLGFPDSNGLIGFLRMGNDLTENYYQIEIPLTKSQKNARSVDEVWPEENEINIALEVLGKVKAKAIADGPTPDGAPRFYDVVNDNVTEVSNEFTGYQSGQHRVGIKGYPNFGDVRTLMVGVKNAHSSDICAQVWFNELRLSDMDNKGGWATVVSLDTNLADFANISATGRKSTTGFGSLQQGPNERSLEDVQQYDFVTNVNLGKLLPEKWGIQLPFNYAQGEELVTPKFDMLFEDLTLESRIQAENNEADKKIIKQRSEDHTKRQSINFIGVKKNRTNEETKPRFYDVENLTLNYSFNKVQHRDFEIENSLNNNLRLGANYAFNFNPVKVEPFKKNDSLFTGKYWKILKDFNVNLLPTSFTFSTDLNRQFNKQKFRDGLGEGNIATDELFRRNYIFDYQYNFNYNLTNSLQVNFAGANNNIVRNYFINDNILEGEQDPSLDIWDGLLDLGDPNRFSQDLGLTYKLPINKIPTFSFIDATYQYSGNFQWQKGSDLFGNLEYEGEFYDLGNTIQNANTHNANASLDMNKFYKYLGLVKQPMRGGSRAKNAKGKQPKTKSKSTKRLMNAGVSVLTVLKRVQFNYSENNGTLLPGYLQTPGFIGASKPTLAYVFGSQNDVRHLAARRGWLTNFPDFNQQYTENTTKQFDYSANLELLKDLKIDIVGNRAYSENYSENYRVENNIYEELSPNTFGNFNISTVLVKTAFSRSDETTSEAFNDFRANRIKVANRLAEEFYGTSSFPTDVDTGYPVGFGKSSQNVLLPAFLSAYSGQDANKIKTSAFRDVPLPNWDLKYTGFMKFKWFKERFKRFSLTHGYRSTYTINQFQANLDYNPDNPQDSNQAGNFKTEILFNNINLTESFSPLARLEFEMMNSVKILTEIKKDRMISLSFDNNLITEILGNEYVVGLGYRFKDLRIKSKLAGPNKRVVSDLNMRADMSLRENKTIIRYLDLDNNQITSGQTIWGAKYSADYAFSKNLTAIFYFDYTFSKYAISTAFPLTSIRSGFTLRYNFGN